MWGVPGAILAVPMLAILKIVSDRVRPLKALGHVLEGLWRCGLLRRDGLTVELMWGARTVTKARGRGRRGELANTHAWSRSGI